MDEKPSCTTSCDVFFPYHEHNKRGESPWGLKVGHMWDETNQWPMMGKAQFGAHCGGENI